MTVPPTGVAATGTEGATTTEQPKPTETVDFWKQKAREQEKRAKDNSDAAKRLAEIEELQKSAEQKAADRVTKAEAEAAAVPAKVAEALRAHLVKLHEIDAERADLFLTATDPEMLLRQVNGLVAETSKKTRGNTAPKEGGTADIPGATTSDMREFARNMFGRAD